MDPSMDPSIKGPFNYSDTTNPGLPTCKEMQPVLAELHCSRGLSKLMCLCDALQE